MVFVGRVVRDGLVWDLNSVIVVVSMVIVVVQRTTVQAQIATLLTACVPEVVFGEKNILTGSESDCVVEYL